MQLASNMMRAFNYHAAWPFILLISFKFSPCLTIYLEGNCVVGKRKGVRAVWEIRLSWFVKFQLLSNWTVHHNRTPIRTLTFVLLVHIAQIPKVLHRLHTFEQTETSLLFSTNMLSFNFRLNMISREEKAGHASSYPCKLLQRQVIVFVSVKQLQYSACSARTKTNRFLQLDV